MAFDLNGRSNTIRVPTVIIGNQDVPTPPSNSFQMAEKIPVTQIREIDGAGHILDQPSGGDLVDSKEVQRPKLTCHEANRIIKEKNINQSRDRSVSLFHFGGFISLSAL
jgi:hypothetical protein